MLRFLLDASLPRASRDLIRSLGHDAIDVRDVHLGSAPDTDVAAYAQANRLCLITRDKDFGHLQGYPPEQYAGIVVLRAPERAGRAFVLDMLGQFLRQTDVLKRLAGRLAIVEPGQIRLRPA